MSIIHQTKFTPGKSLKAFTSALIASLTLMGSSVFAQDTEQSMCERGHITKVFFTNGITTTRAEARAYMDAIKSAYHGDLITRFPEETFEFRVAYNPTYGFQTDLREVSLQRSSGTINLQLTKFELLSMMELSTDTLRQLRASAESVNNQRLMNIATVAIEAKEADTFGGDLSIHYQELMGELNTAARDQLTETSQVLYQEYRRALMAGERVIVFAHSQGNLFANEAVARLHQENGAWAQSISIINVANPDARVLNGSFCVTADDDRVIELLSSYEEVADCSIDNDPSVLPFDRDGLNHGFLSAYFAEGLASRSSIDGFMESLVAGLEFPEQELGDGAMRATLEWDGSQDIDLHIAEPNGQIVYYGSKVGLSGQLDRDDVDGIGPENYFVGCDTLEEGTYQFLVKYYGGSGSTTVTKTLNLSTFTGATSRAVTILSQAGETEILFNVTVINDDGSYKIDIHQGDETSEIEPFIEG